MERSAPSRALLAVGIAALACGNADESDGEDASSLPLVGVDPGHTALPVPESPAAMFADITQWAGLAIPVPGEGIGFADVDGDGADDIVLPGDGATWVFRNRGDGSYYPIFQLDHAGEMALFPYALDATGDGIVDLLLIRRDRPALYGGFGNGAYESLVGAFPPPEHDVAWAVATFGDLDADGHTELYLGRLVRIVEGYVPTPNPDAPGGEAVGGPTQEGPPVRDLLLDGDIEAGYLDMAAARGVVQPRYTQAAMVTDLNGDGRLDLLVGTEGFYADGALMANPDGTFTDRAAELGIDAVTSAMGFDAVDVDGNGELDLYITDEAVGSGDKLYLQSGGTFTLATEERGLGHTQTTTGWGVGFHDLDNDGDLDLYVANGRAGTEPGGEQENSLFLNDGTGHFQRVEAPHGSGLRALYNSRAAVFADIDDDGDLDILLSNVGAAPTLLRNDLAAGNHWLKLRLNHPTLMPPIGATVTVTSGGRTMRRDVKGTPSYGGSSTSVVHVGLGAAASATVGVRWPDGTVHTHENIAADQTVTLDFLR